MQLLVSSPVFRANPGFAKVSTTKIISRHTGASGHIKVARTFAARPPVYTCDYLTPTPSHLLNLTLAGIIPEQCSPPHFEASDLTLPHVPFRSSSHALIPQGHHLVYFSPQVLESDLLADGTDPLQYPGPPFQRRLWAGGSLLYPTSRTQQLRSDRTRSTCKESISGIKHNKHLSADRDERVFVNINRHIMTGSEDVSQKFDARNVAVLEKRNLVFFRPISDSQARERLEEPDRIIPSMYAQDPRCNIS
jgi:hydroxyacyl-ACP dehydratase HTD2-like protein with hotdog domain